MPAARMMRLGYQFPYWRTYQVEVQQRGTLDGVEAIRHGNPQLPYGPLRDVKRCKRARTTR